MEAEPRIKLEIDAEVLRCRDTEGAIAWETPIAKIVLIAEYTTDEGPWVDDYFLHFWSDEESRLLRASATYYADGCVEVIQELSKRLGAKIELGLHSSAEWKSRVLWPPELADHPYFTFREVEPNSWLQRVKRCGFGPTLEYSPSHEVKTFLRRYEPDANA